VQIPAAQQEPCCAGVALQVDAAQLRVVEKLPRQASAVVSLQAPILGLQHAPCDINEHLASVSMFDPLSIRLADVLCAQPSSDSML
jgi:hypothetical protein